MAQGLGVGQKHPDQRLWGCRNPRVEGAGAWEGVSRRRPSFAYPPSTQPRTPGVVGSGKRPPVWASILAE